MMWVIIIILFIVISIANVVVLQRSIRQQKRFEKLENMLKKHCSSLNNMQQFHRGKILESVDLNQILIVHQQPTITKNEFIQRKK